MDEAIVGTYTIWKKCWNCRHNNCLSIPIGKTVDDFLDNNPCKYCGCHIRLKETLVEQFDKNTQSTRTKSENQDG